MSISGNVAVVTGAGGGIGQAVAVHLAERGAVVALLERRAELAAETEQLIRDAGGQARAFGADVSETTSVAEVFGQIKQSMGAVRHLVTSAAILTTNVTAEEADLDEFDRAMAVNVKGTFAAAQAAFRHMRDLGGGSIVTMASQAALLSLPFQATYTATKGAVTALTRSLAIDWAQYGIRVNSVAPTFTATPMAREMLADQDLSRQILARIPLGRVAEPHDVATAISFLLSDDARMITGHCLPVDGGWTAGEVSLKL